MIKFNYLFLAEEGFSPVAGIDGSNAFGEDMLQMALKMATEYEDQPVDLESAMTANTITPSSHPGMPGKLTKDIDIIILNQMAPLRSTLSHRIIQYLNKTMYIYSISRVELPKKITHMVNARDLH